MRRRLLFVAWPAPLPCCTRQAQRPGCERAAQRLRWECPGGRHTIMRVCVRLRCAAARTWLLALACLAVSCWLPVAATPLRSDAAPSGSISGLPPQARRALRNAPLSGNRHDRVTSGVAPLRTANVSRTGRYPDAAYDLPAILAAHPGDDVVLFQFEAHNKFQYLYQARSLCVRLRHLGLDYIAYGESDVACDLLGGAGGDGGGGLGGGGIEASCIKYSHAEGDPLLEAQWSLPWHWSKRYALVAELALAGKNVLLVDADVMLHVNPFPLLKQIQGAKMIVLPEGGLGNGGFNYMPAAASEDEDAVRLVRRCVKDWVSEIKQGRRAPDDQNLMGAAVDEYTTGFWTQDNRTYSSPLLSAGHPPIGGAYQNVTLEKRDFKSGGSVFRAPAWIVTGGTPAMYGWSWTDTPPSSAASHLLGVETAFVEEVTYHGSHVGRVLYGVAFGYVDVPCTAELTSIAPRLVEAAANVSFAALHALLRNAYFSALASDTLLLVPPIPCHTHWLKRDPAARFGILDRRVIATKDACYLTAGGWDDCWPGEHVCVPAPRLSVLTSAPCRIQPVAQWLGSR